MGFRQGAFARVWQVEPKSERWTKIRISISRKNADTGEYEDEFSGFIDCIGSACAAKAAKLKERDRIRLGNVDVTNKYVKEKNTTYTNFKMTSFDMADEAGEPKKEQTDARYEGENEPSSDLPF